MTNSHNRITHVVTRIFSPEQIKRRAAYDRLIASLKVPQHTSIATPQPGKALPASGVFASV